MTDRKTPPTGFITKTVDTEASGVKYSVDVLQAESLQAWLDFYAEQGKNAEEVINKILNADNEQGGKQTGKEAVRKVIAEHGPDSDEAKAAITTHQDNARQFIQGAPRGGGGKKHESGLTQKQREAFGGAVAIEYGKTGKAPAADRLKEIADELGIDHGALGL